MRLAINRCFPSPDVRELRAIERIHADQRIALLVP
jgi:hypothetical protein